MTALVGTILERLARVEERVNAGQDTLKEHYATKVDLAELRQSLEDKLSGIRVYEIATLIISVLVLVIAVAGLLVSIFGG